MKITVEGLISKGKWRAYCSLKGIAPCKVNTGEIDDQMEITLSAEEVAALDLGRKNSVCGDSN